MKTNFYCDFFPAQIDNFHIDCSNQYDINQIYHFILNPIPNVPMNDEQIHNHLVETRKRLDIIINVIKNYENENKENPTNHLEDN